jgi:hypothetical protein
LLFVIHKQTIIHSDKSLPRQHLVRGKSAVRLCEKRKAPICETHLRGACARMFFFDIRAVSVTTIFDVDRRRQ